MRRNSPGRLRARALLAFGLLALALAAGADENDPSAATPSLTAGASAGADAGPRAAILADGTAMSLGFSSGGWGLALGGELRLGGGLSLFGELEYLDLRDGGTTILLALAGPRLSFSPPALKGWYAGAYPAMLWGRRPGEAELLGGFLLELGYAWLPRRCPGLLIEPAVKYPYFFGDETLVGIAPGISFGWVFY